MTTFKAEPKDEPLESEATSSAGRRIHDRLQNTRSLWTAVKAFPLEHDIRLKGQWIPLFGLTFVLGLVLYLVQAAGKVLTVVVLGGDPALLQVFYRSALDTGVPLQTVSGAIILGNVFLAGVIVMGGWVIVWKLVRWRYPVPTGDASVTVEVHKVREKVLSLYSGRNITDNTLKFLSQLPYAGKVLLKPIAEIPTTAPAEPDTPTAIYAAEVTTSTKFNQDDLGRREDANEILDSLPEDLGSPLAEPLQGLEDGNAQVHIQSAFTAVLGGRAAQAEKLERHIEGNNTVEDDLRAETVREASGDYLAASMRVIAFADPANPEEIEQVEEVFDGVEGAISHLVADGVSVNLTRVDSETESWLDVHLPWHTTVGDVIDRFENRVVSDETGFILPAELAGQLLAIPSQASSDVEAYSDPDWPTDRPLPAAEATLESAYDPDATTAEFAEEPTHND